MNITVSKPLPRQKKKTCYNYKCKYLKNFTFNTKTKEYEKTNCTNGINRTFGKSFYDKNFDNETKETSMAFNNWLIKIYFYLKKHIWINDAN